MSEFPWLPLGFDIGNGVRSGRLLAEGPGYQLTAEDRGTGTVLLIDPGAVPASPALARVLAKAGRAKFGPRELAVMVFPEGARPSRVGDLHRHLGLTYSDLSALMAGLRKMQTESPSASWDEALHLPSESECVPILLQSDRASRHEIAVRIMTGGVADRTLSAQQVKTFATWLTVAEIERFLALCGDETQSDDGAGSRPRAPASTRPNARSSATPDAEFKLAGQPEFTRIVNEYIVDFMRDPQRFSSMGVRMPNGILLYGAPGSGKTYALRKLSEFLSWNVKEISLGTVGSIYIHQTSQTLRKIFDQAAAGSPSLLIVNEIEALTRDRGRASHDHRLEETNELLLLVESASERGILVAGTTNRREEIDSAFLRRGRFDIQIEMTFPGDDQVGEILNALLAERPCAAGLNLDQLAREMTGRPPSDIDWVVNEAARLAARSGKDAIDDICLMQALRGLGKTSKR